MAAFFLSCGAKGYIGTLWAIGNDAAVAGARAFYEHVFSGTVLNAFHKAVKAVEKTESKDIYLYWGLHFTTLPAAYSAERSRSEIFQELLSAVGEWIRQIQTTQSAEVRKNARRILHAVVPELAANFGPADLKRLQQELQARIDTSFRGATSPAAEESVPISARRSIDHPTVAVNPIAC